MSLKCIKCDNNISSGPCICNDCVLKHHVIFKQQVINIIQKRITLLADLYSHKRLIELKSVLKQIDELT